MRLKSHLFHGQDVKVGAEQERQERPRGLIENTAPKIGDINTGGGHVFIWKKTVPSSRSG